jgi:uncharacterized protein YjbJ (UPF0337 family)
MLHHQGRSAGTRAGQPRSGRLEDFMNQDDIAGTAQRVAGKVQEGVGNLTGDARTQAEGSARQVYGSAQQAYGGLRDSASHGVEAMQEQVRNYPLGALMLAGALGYIIGRLAGD